jgi:hypothetical protein
VLLLVLVLVLVLEEAVSRQLSAISQTAFGARRHGGMGARGHGNMGAWDSLVLLLVLEEAISRQLSAKPPLAHGGMGAWEHGCHIPCQNKNTPHFSETAPGQALAAARGKRGVGEGRGERHATLYANPRPRG